MVAYGTSFFGRPAELVFVLITERRTVGSRAALPEPPRRRPSSLLMTRLFWARTI